MKRVFPSFVADQRPRVAAGLDHAGHAGREFARLPHRVGIRWFDLVLGCVASLIPLAGQFHRGLEFGRGGRVEHLHILVVKADGNRHFLTDDRIEAGRLEHPVV